MKKIALSLSILFLASSVFSQGLIPLKNINGDTLVIDISDIQMAFISGANTRIVMTGRSGDLTVIDDLDHIDTSSCNSFLDVSSQPNGSRILVNKTSVLSIKKDGAGAFITLKGGGIIKTTTLWASVIADADTPIGCGGSGGGGVTNLSTGTRTSTTFPINNSNGTGVTIDNATIEGGTNVAGLMTPIEKGQMTQQTIAYSATISANLNNGNRIYVDMTGDAAIAAPSNSVAGEEITYILTANGANRTATFASVVFKEEDGVTDVGAEVITSGSTKAFTFKVGPTVLHRIGGGSGSGDDVSTFTDGTTITPSEKLVSPDSLYTFAQLVTFLKDSIGVASVAYNGSTLTITRRDGTTATTALANVVSGAGAPVGAPGTGQRIYINQTDTTLYVAIGANWALLPSSGGSDGAAIETNTVPSGGKAGDMAVHTNLGQFYIHDGTAYNAQGFPDGDFAKTAYLTTNADLTPNLSTGLRYTWSINGNYNLQNPTFGSTGRKGVIAVTNTAGTASTITTVGGNYVDENYTTVSTIVIPASATKYLTFRQATDSGGAVVMLENVTNVVSSSAVSTDTITHTSHGFSVGNLINIQSVTGIGQLADADVDSLFAVGIVTEVINANSYVIQTDGIATISGVVAGQQYYTSGTAGAVTTTAPAKVQVAYQGISANTARLVFDRFSQGLSTTYLTTVSRDATLVGAGTSGDPLGADTSILVTQADLAAAVLGSGASGVITFNGRTGTVNPASNDYTGTQITNTPAGNIAAENAQAAINELDSEKLSNAPGQIGITNFDNTLQDWGDNRADTALFLVGLYNSSTGAFTATAPWRTTGKQPCLPSTEYVMWSTTGNLSHAPRYFESDGTTYIGIGPAPTSGVVTFTTPANCYFVAGVTSNGPGQTLQEFKETIMFEYAPKSSVYSAPARQFILQSRVDSLHQAALTYADSLHSTALTYAFLDSIGSDLSVLKSGDYLYIRSRYNETKDLVQQVEVWDAADYTTNGVVAPQKAWTINKTAANTTTAYNAGYLVKNCSDDEAPVFVNSPALGAGHGLSYAVSVTATAHGKANVDVGSSWTDGAANTWYLMRVVDANTLWMLGAETSGTYIWTFPSSITGTLTHASGATNTGTITVGAQSATQMYPVIKNVTKYALLNGVDTLDSGSTDSIYFCDFLDIVDVHDIVDPVTNIDSVAANVGTATPDIAIGDTLFGNRILYRYTGDGTCLVAHNFRAYKQFNLTRHGFTQFGLMNELTYANTKMYIPRSLPVTSGSSYDFRTLQAWASANAPAGQILIDSTKWEDANFAPERAIQFACDGSNNRKYAQAIGYIPTKALGIDTVRFANTNVAWSLSTSRKNYPWAINYKLGDPAANFWRTAFVYRKFFDPESIPTKTAFYWVELGGEVLVYVDYHSDVSFDALPLPAKYVGMNAEIIYKSTNLTLHTNEVMQDGLTVSVSGGTYAYACIRLKI